MKQTMSAEQARKKVKGEDQAGNSKKASSKSSSKKSMKQKSSCLCGR